MTRPPRSLGYQTDLALLRLEGAQVEEADGYSVVRTPGNPTFWWGNFLLLDALPQPGSLETWLTRFREAHLHADHVTFGVDTTDGVLDDRAASEFVAAGFTTFRNTVLTASQTALHRPLPPGVTLRPLDSEADWEAALDLRLAVNAADSQAHEEVGYRVFAARKLAALRSAGEAGHGAYFGAFEDGRMLAGLGVYDAGRGVARYQNVETHPEARSRGLAGNLVHRAGEWAWDHLGARTLVIVADPEYHAQRLYERVGFRPAQVQLGLERSPAQR
ncbi:GNAT family N-acetyltransferase [Deinococcus planocerae]|uniref:GNAT family N-acetyltransferase n=1 Tax=Deinococcus planocerae TaxID=1737569 RepID=UPI000C7F767E|nr:GNAT family N-acetyltransferase [Deinococcus planocerae]